MPSLELASCYQRAVVWPVTAGASWDRYGRPSKTINPVEVSCRWVDGDYEGMDLQGNAITLNAKVHVPIPQRTPQGELLTDIPVQSRLWLGTLAAYNAAITAPIPPDLRVMEVKTYDKTPDIKGRFSLRQLGLMRYTNQPTK